VGLRYVKGLGPKDWEAIRAVRDSARGQAGRPGEALDLSEFIRRTRIDEGNLAALAEAGALRSFGVDRRAALWRVSGTGRRRDLSRRDTPGSDLPIGDEELPPEFAALNSFESIGWDYRVMGHSVHGHPLEPFREELARQGLPDAGAVNAGEDGRRLSYAGLVISRQRPGTARGVVFMTLEDETGFVNCVVWAQVFEKYRTVILSNAVLGVSGKLQSQEGVVHVVVESCWRPRLSRLPASKESRDFHETSAYLWRSSSRLATK
jgi:error-prone DNA polymerase